MDSQTAHRIVSHKKKILLIALPVLVLGVAVLLLVSFNNGKNPLKNGNLLQKGPNVSLKSEYKNPFEKETQYVNPFETYKNPFVVNK